MNRVLMRQVARRVVLVFLFFVSAGVLLAQQNERVGAEDTAYLQLEFAPDGSGWMAWNEREAGASAAWLGRADLQTGQLIPPDGRGILLADFATEAGYVQWGRDQDGLFIVFPKRKTGILTLARVRSNGTVRIRDLATPRDKERDTVYGSASAIGSGWVSYLSKGSAWVVSLNRPARPIRISGDLKVGVLGPRWFPGQKLVIFATEPVNGGNEIWQVNVTSGVPSSPVKIVGDGNLYDGVFPFLLPDGRRAIVAGINRSGDVALLVKSSNSETYTLLRRISLPLGIENSAASSPEPFLSGDRAYVLYSIFEKGAVARDEDPYIRPGQILLADLAGEEEPSVVSSGGPDYRFEPEPLYGSKKGFYSSRELINSVTHLRYADLSEFVEAPARILP